MKPLEPLPALAMLLGAGALAQWIAWRFRLPAILLLLGLGFLAGPITGILDPDLVFGASFRPLVSLSVGIILFEGGLTLRFEELRGSGKVVRNLVTIGALITWVLTSLAARYLVGVDLRVAILVGAILVLTGPTVVIPLVRHVRPRAPLGPILRWEGILIDPIGAVLSLLVLEAISGDAKTFTDVGISLLETVAVGGGLGMLAGLGLARALERFHIPDMLHVPVTLGTVAVAFVSANLLQAEAGLLAVTVMGIVLANRKALDITHIAEWKEQLSTVLLAILFLSLAARLPLEQVTQLGWRAALFTGVLIVVVRPVAVLFATLGTGTNWPDRAFLMAMAPRGIVVAAVSSEFALHFEQSGHEGGPEIVALVFPVIVLSVLVYGLLSRPFARALGVAKEDPQGVLIVGADRICREIGAALKTQEIEVLLVDTNARNTAEARTLGLRTWHGSVLSARFADEAELAGIGNVLAMTPSDEVNRLSVRQFLSTFGRAGSFVICPTTKAKVQRSASEPGRTPFQADCTLEALHARLRGGARFKATRLTEQFGPEQFLANQGEHTLPMFWLTPEHKLHFVTAESEPPLKVGCTILSLVGPSPANDVTKGPDGTSAGESPSAAKPAAT
jgi:NhaP-type Na+/H+ or K+/H+ antiporter